VGGGVVWLVLGALAGCARAQPEPTADPPLVVHVSPAGDSVRLVLLAAPGWKINARLKPVVEAVDGRRLQLDARRLTADSAYFAEPPSVVAAGRAGGIRGTLRASVCSAGETVCRVMTLEVRGER
jgi:hypothetical protein